MTKPTEVKIIDCDCNGGACCGGRGIAVFQVTRNGKKMNVCTRCDFSDDKDKKILRYVMRIPFQQLIDFDPLGAMCLASDIKDKQYPFVTPKRGKGKKNEVCGCDEDPNPEAPGYHTKNCDMKPYGFNDGLRTARAIVEETL